MPESIPASTVEKQDRPAIEDEAAYFDAVNDLFFATEKLEGREEPLPYPGLTAGTYETLKREYLEFPEYATDPDLLLQRFLREGVRVFIEGNDVFVGPQTGETSTTDCLPIALLDAERADSPLKELILTAQRIKAYHQKQKAQR